MVFYFCDETLAKVVAHDYQMDGNDEMFCQFTPLGPVGNQTATWEPATSRPTEDIVCDNIINYPIAPILEYPDSVPATEWPYVQGLESGSGGYLMTCAIDVGNYTGTAQPEYIWPSGIAYLQPLLGLTGYPFAVFLSQYHMFDSCSASTLRLRWLPQQHFPTGGQVQIYTVTMEMSFNRTVRSIFESPGVSVTDVNPRFYIKLVDPIGLSVEDWKEDFKYGTNLLVKGSDTKIYKSLQESCGYDPTALGSSTRWVEVTLRGAQPPVSSSPLEQISYYGHLEITYENHLGVPCKVTTAEFPVLNSTQAFAGLDPEDPLYDELWYITTEARTLEMKPYYQGDNSLETDSVLKVTFETNEWYLYINETPLNHCDWCGVFKIEYASVLGEETPANALEVSVL